MLYVCFWAVLNWVQDTLYTANAVGDNPEFQLD